MKKVILELFSIISINIPPQPSVFMRENCADGEYRVGLKSLHDLYPAKVREKINAEERQNWWDEAHKKAAAEVLRKSSAVDKKNSSSSTGGQSLEEKLNQENNEALAELNNLYEKKFSDLKTTYDCVSFKATTDGLWYAVIDTTETVSESERDGEMHDTGELDDNHL